MAGTKTQKISPYKALAKKLGETGAWVRLMYLYPYPRIIELIELMAEGLLLPYLDIPLQHASPSILRAMKRPGNQAKQLNQIETWRSIVPNLTFRSTFIVGFPGETESDFECLLDFLETARLDRVGAFTFSPVEGAEATEMPNQVPEEIKQERLERLMNLQAQIAKKSSKRKWDRSLRY